eukprot:Em0015g236a
MGKGIKTASGEIVTLKTNYKAEAKIEAFYTGGRVEFSGDDSHMFCTCGSAVQILTTEDGHVERTIAEEEDQVTSLAVSGDSQIVVVAWRSLLLKQYEWQKGTCTRSWKGHIGPVMSMAFDSTSTLLATGATDSVIKVWDCIKNYCTHNLRGSVGVVSLVQFHPDPSQLKMFSCSMDCAIRVWDLQKSCCIHLLSGHVSAVTSFGFSPDGHTLLSGGRDKVILVWDLTTGRNKGTVTVFEGIEGMVVIPNDARQNIKGLAASPGDIVVATAGDKGLIRLWSVASGQVLKTLEPLAGHAPSSPAGQAEDKASHTYVSLQYRPTIGGLVGVTYDHNILFYTGEDLKRTKQFIGYPDEVLDLRLVGEGQGLLAVATNSEQVKVFDRKTKNCQILTGHGGIVLSLDASHDGNMIVTGSKDNTIRVWQLDPVIKCFSLVGVGTGHTQSVGAVAFSRVKGTFVISGSQDQTLKLWNFKNIQSSDKDEPLKLTAKYTQLAHEKDINSVDISPNDKLIVTGSQDKTAKLWQRSDGSLLGTFKGHRRGVWSVKFSPVDQCIATTSGDSTIKLWAIADFSCVKTFEGHTSSVLRAIFITRGMQIASSGSDGLVKVWTIKTNECVATLDLHTEKIWALTGSLDDQWLLSGGADSLICQWKDVTAEVEAQEVEAQEELVLREQELSNLLLKKDYVNAVGLAISLNQPFRVLTILTDLLNEGGTEGDFSKTLCLLREDQMQAILKFIVKWNMNAKNTRVAQTVLKHVLCRYPPEVLAKFEGIQQTVEGLVPYTERHFQRLSRLQQLATFVDYTWQRMRICSEVSAVPDEAHHFNGESQPQALTLVNTDNTQLKVAADADISLDYMEDIVSHVGLCPETETHDTNALSCDTNTPPCDTNAPSCDDHDDTNGDGGDGDGDGDGEQIELVPSRRSSRKKPSSRSSVSSKRQLTEPKSQSSRRAIKTK